MIWLLRFIATIIAFPLVIPLVILYKLRLISFLSIAQLLSLIPGQFGIYLRRAWYKLTLTHCGKTLTVDFMGAIRTPKTTIGNNVYIGVYSFVGLANIGDDTMISGYTLILSGAGQHGTAKLDVPMRLQEGKVQQINIGKDSWIGAHATILADVSDHTVIGAGSVVTKKFNPYDIIAGVPAKKIKSRKNK